ncbi:MAG: FAD-binding protein [Victivallales bacterium]|nr:FAD-binding protein [Victivallales bacterium]
MIIKLDNLKIRAYSIPPQETDIDQNLNAFIAQHLEIKESDIIDYKIVSKAIDSRRGAPALIYKLTVNLHENEAAQTCIEYKVSDEEIKKNLEAKLEFPDAPAGLKNPLIIGSGPAGLMAALVLAQSGCEPIIIERGHDVDKRTLDIDKFHQTRKFNPDSNYLLGEGGAGTFSDGKLYTRTNDPRARFVLKTFSGAGAPHEILYVKRPHIGSDKLPNMVRSLREQIEQAGGKFLFGTRVKELIIEDNKCKGVITQDGERIEAPAVIAAHGLGGRSFTHRLIEQGVEFALKGFQVGCRVEHPQSLVDENQYRIPIRPTWLGAAEYHLSNRKNNLWNIAGASSFCMCPGGIIVPASLEPGHLSTNGMSRYDRDGKFANSCLIVSQPDDMFSNPHQAYKFLRGLEKKAFELGGGDYTAPAQDVRAFVKGKLALKNEETSYSLGLKSARIDQLLPEKTAEALVVALRKFDNSFHGFMKYGKIIGIETFISSPIRFVRNAETLSTSVDKLYSSGEGAGYAGGILSAAVDGIKIAEKLLEAKY